MSSAGSRYEDLYLGAWAARTAAGDAAASWQACLDGRSAVRLGEHGALACIAEEPWPEDLLQLTLPLARALWDGADEVPVLAFGISKGDVHHLRRLLDGDGEAFARWPTGAFIPRLARELGIRRYYGTAPVAACSSGLYALLGAADLLAEGMAGRALCGSADAACDPLLLAAYRAMGVQASCQPTVFDGAGTGFAVGEGAAVLRLQRGYGPWRLLGGVRLGDARHITRCEDPRTLHRCLETLWHVLPEPDLIIAHATGTRAGDAYEQAALAEGPWSDCPVRCCKHIIGHCLGASGLVELALGLEAPVGRLWKISLGFGGHLAGVACVRP